MLSGLAFTPGVATQLLQPPQRLFKRLDLHRHSQLLTIRMGSTQQIGGYPGSVRYLAKPEGTAPTCQVVCQAIQILPALRVSGLPLDLKPLTLYFVARKGNCAIKALVTASSCSTMLTLSLIVAS